MNCAALWVKDKHITTQRISNVESCFIQKSFLFSEIIESKLAQSNMPERQKEKGSDAGWVFEKVEWHCWGYPGNSAAKIMRFPVTQI